MPASIPAYSRSRTGKQKQAAAASDHLHHQAFDNSLLANLISTVQTGLIIKANRAACRLWGYSKKELLGKTMKQVFKASDKHFTGLLKKRSAEGHAKAEVVIIKKNGKSWPCEVTSVIFNGADGTETAITTIVDICQTSLKKKDREIRRLNTEIQLQTSQQAEAVTEAHEEERSNLGKELHDNVNQLLSVSRLYLAMGRKEGVNQEMYLNRSAEYTLNAIEEIRKLTKDLIGTVIKDLGLRDAIETAIKDTMEIYPVKIFFTQDRIMEGLLNNKMKLNLFRIVQEQLNNILKHASATLVNIGLSQNKVSTLLYVSDNGVGFDPAKKAIGIGIKNIRNRAKSLHGKASFASQPGKGCVLTVAFPRISLPAVNKQAVLL